VVPDKRGALLQQDGKTLRLTILEPAGAKVTVVPLDPPPLKLDKRIPHLKRIKINCPAAWFGEKGGKIRVRLSGSREGR
jgi:hypothetical protein